MKKGFFITLEGFEGSGKTTVAKRLYQIFLKNGFDTLLTKEPGGTLVGDKIRKILLERESEGLGYKAELLLFAASRAENVRINIKPALEKNLMVICDRYFDSTTAYQGFGRGIDMSAISYLNSFAIEGIIPDLTIFLDVDTEIGLKRATMLSNNSELRFEDEFLKKKEVNGKLFLARVRDGYCQIARQYPERIKIIDANQDISMVIKDIIEIINPKLAQKFKKEFSLEL
jgi:dTMP kinase